MVNFLVDVFEQLRIGRHTLGLGLNLQLSESILDILDLLPFCINEQVRSSPAIQESVVLQLRLLWCSGRLQRELTRLCDR